MAKNLGREFATMSDDQRRKYAFEEGGDALDRPEELDFEDPRDPDRIGKQYGSLKEEFADPDNRDGTGALLDDEAHNRTVESQRAARREDDRHMALHFGSNASAGQWENLRRPPTAGRGWGVNVGTAERWISGLAGAALMVTALRRRRLRGLLFPMGGGLLARAVTGRCAVNRALGRNSVRRDTVSPVASIERGAGIKVETSIDVFRPRDEIYRFWRNFENLPRFMDHLEAVTVIDENRSHWVVRGPMGTRVEWDAEIHNEIPNELIAWRTLPGSEVNHAGSVHFEPRLPGPGTTVRVILRYEPPAGKPGAALASLFGEGPGQQIEDDLRRFKQVMEAGESVSTRGTRG